MSSQPVDRLHPVLDFAHRLRERLDSVAKVPLWSMTPEEQREALTTLAQAEAQLDALKLRLLAEADRSGATTETGAGTAADWIAIETRQVRRDARSDLRLAQALDRYDVLAAAMAEGRVNTAQARAIVAALDKLPTTGEFAVDTEQRGAAETHLVALAEHHDAKALRILGGRIFEVIAPDLAEKFDGKALEAEEARALRRTTFTMFEDDEGTCHGRFRIPALHGQMLTKMILAISSPPDPPTTQPLGRDRPRPAHPGPPRHRPDPADRDLPRREAPQDRRLLRHRRGHHDPRTTPRRPRPRRRLHPRHRRPHHRQPKPDVSPAPPGSSPSSSAERARSSTSAANADSTPRPCASR